MTKGKLIVTAFTAGLLAASIFNKPEAEHHTKVITETDIQTVTKTVRVPVPVEFPGQCDLVLTYADRLTRAAIALDSDQSEQLDILSNARLAIASQDINRLNELDTRQRKLKDEAISSYLTIARIEANYPVVRQECKDLINEQ